MIIHLLTQVTVLLMVHLLEQVIYPVPSSIPLLENVPHLRTAKMNQLVTVQKYVIQQPIHVSQLTIHVLLNDEYVILIQTYVKLNTV